MDEKQEHKDKHGAKLDSVTFGTPAKGGAVKVYFDLENMSDAEVLVLVNRAKNLYLKSTQ